MRCTPSNMNRSMPNRSMLSGLLLAALLAGTVSAQFSETSTYNDEACQDLNNTLVVNGVLGSTDEVTPFYSCSNLTNVSAQSSSYECANDEAVKIIYDNDDCSGEGNMTVVTLFNGTCIQGQISTCSLDELDVSTNWTVDATFYSNENCSVTNGNTSSYTMAQFMDLYQENGSCESVDVDGVPMFLALRCVDEKLGRAYYNESDSTCSSEVVIVETDVYGCVTSAAAAGPYLGAYCYDITNTSDWVDDVDDVSEWDIKSNWTVQAMFYSDENCSVANGETSNYTMAQFMELYQLNGTCESLDSANASYAFRCINGLLGWAFYNESNSTCSEDVLYVSTDNFGCVVSSNDSEKYLGATCTGSMDISGGTDDDYTYWNGSDDDFYYYPYWNGSDDDFYDYPYWNGSDDDFVVWLDDDSDSNWDILVNSTVLGTFYLDENCSVANGQTSNFALSEFMELYEVNETCSFYFGDIFKGIRCINERLGWAFYNDSTCSLDVIGGVPEIFHCEESAPGMSATLGEYLEVNCTEIAETSVSDDSDDYNDAPSPTPASDDDFSGGASSFHLAECIVRFGWSILAAAAIPLAPALV